MRFPLIDIPERDLERIEDKAEAQRFKEARIDGYVDRFDEYMKEQSRAQRTEELPREITHAPDDLSEHRQSVDMASFDSHEWAVQKNLEEIRDFAAWQRNERQEMRRSDYEGFPTIPETNRADHHFLDREATRDKYSEIFRETFDSFQEQRNIERFTAIERAEQRNIENLAGREKGIEPERSGQQERSQEPEPSRESQRSEEPSRSNDGPARPADRLAEWLAREAPREIRPEEPTIERDEPTLSR